MDTGDSDNANDTDIVNVGVDTGESVTFKEVIAAKTLRELYELLERAIRAEQRAVESGYDIVSRRYRSFSARAEIQTARLVLERIQKKIAHAEARSAERTGKRRTEHKYKTYGTVTKSVNSPSVTATILADVLVKVLNIQHRRDREAAREAARPLRERPSRYKTKEERFSDEARKTLYGGRETHGEAAAKPLAEPYHFYDDAPVNLSDFNRTGIYSGPQAQAQAQTRSTTFSDRDQAIFAKARAYMLAEGLTDVAALAKARIAQDVEDAELTLPEQVSQEAQAALPSGQGTQITVSNAISVAVSAVGTSSVFNALEKLAPPNTESTEQQLAIEPEKISVKAAIGGRFSRLLANNSETLRMRELAIAEAAPEFSDFESGDLNL